MQHLNALQTTTFTTTTRSLNLAMPALALVGTGSVAGMAWLVATGNVFGLTVSAAVIACVGVQALVLGTALQVADGAK